MFENSPNCIENWRVGKVYVRQVYFDRGCAEIAQRRPLKHTPADWFQRFLLKWAHIGTEMQQEVSHFELSTCPGAFI